MSNVSYFKSRTEDFAAKVAVYNPEVLSFTNDSLLTYNTSKLVFKAYGGEDISLQQWNDELFPSYSERWDDIRAEAIETTGDINNFKRLSEAERSEMIRRMDLKEDSEVIQEEVDKNKTDSERTERSEVSETIDTVNESPASTGPAQFQCSQGSAYNYNSSGSAEAYGSDVRYEGEFPLSKVIAKKRGGNPPVGWQPWADTLTYVINPVIRAGYFHKEIVVNSSYRSNGSSNHRYLGAIDFGYYGENKLEVLANLARGIVALNLPFDKLLFESDERRYGENSGWIHVQVAKDRNNPARTVISCRDGGCTAGNRVSGINIDYVRRGNIAGVD